MYQLFNTVHTTPEGLKSATIATGSPSSKYEVYATAYVYSELYGKITNRKKNCVSNYLN